MTHRVCAGLMALATTVTLVDGHSYLQFPISRQYSLSPDFHKYIPGDLTQAQLFAYYSGSVPAVIERAAINTSPELLGPGADYFPLYYSDRAENGNYVESNEIAVRHGVCGDPPSPGLDGRMDISTPNSGWEVLSNFKSGQEIEMEVVIGAYHFGHLEFRICDIRDLEYPDGVVTQECFNTYQLNRSPNIGDGSPIDPAYTGRYYADPSCRKAEIEQHVSDTIRSVGADGGLEDIYSFKARYLLPDIECEHCVLQMYHVSGQTCNHVGYAEFNPPSWNSECAPNKGDGWFRYGLDPVDDICGLKGVANPEGNWGYPQEFWSCSDISITRGDGPTGTPDMSSTTTTTNSAAAPTPTTMTSEMSYSSSDSTTTTNNSAAAPTPTTITSEMPYSSSDSTTTTTMSYPSSDSTATTTDSATAPAHTTTTKGMYPSYSGSSGTETTNAGPIPADNSKYEHLGCFLDSKMDRVLAKKSKIDSTEMTAELCSEHCSARGAVYMATQFGRECWCSRNDLLDYDTHGQGGFCDYPCTGDDMEICGGYDAFDLYKLWLLDTEEDRPEYLGCYIDDKDDRVLTNAITTEDMTWAICRDHCADKDALYFATQYGTECWCGTSNNAADYERHGKGICDMACAGDEDVTCGGYDAYSLFKYCDGRE